MPIRRQKIDSLVHDILHRQDVVCAPVPVLRIVEAYGIDVHYDRFDGDLSGFLYRDKDKNIIGINESHPRTRQAFTIAHELGHFLLHDQDQLHVDRDFKARIRDDHKVRMRDVTSSMGYDDDEREANLFAASLLMPRRFIVEDLQNNEFIDILDDGLISKLVKKYKVSTQAFINRLKNLNYIHE